MKTSFFICLVGLLVLTACAAVFYLAGGDLHRAPLPISSPEKTDATPAKPKNATPQLLSEQTPPRSVPVKVTTSPETASSASPATSGDVEGRVAGLEAQVKELQKALAVISLEKASADRQKIFAGEEGYLKADEYAAAGQHAIAGEGYLAFLQNHPQHPDARDVMKKARDAFIKAGYKDKAFWVHEEMMKASPQQQLADMEELAFLEKDAGLYDRASQHMAQAAQLDPNVESRLWKRLYWAYYVQLGSGNRAGLEAVRQVQQEIIASGVTNPKLIERAQQHLVDWQKQLARGE